MEYLGGRKEKNYVIVCTTMMVVLFGFTQAVGNDVVFLKQRNINGKLTYCITVKCEIGQYFESCKTNNTSDSCHKCKNNRVNYSIIDSAKWNYSNGDDVCIDNPCVCHPPEAIRSKNDKCEEKGRPLCHCDRSRNYYGDDFNKCKYFHGSCLAGQELNNKGHCEDCKDGFFKSHSGKGLCEVKTNCSGPGLEILNPGNKTHDTSCNSVTKPDAEREYIPIANNDKSSVVTPKPSDILNHTDKTVIDNDYRYRTTGRNNVTNPQDTTTNGSISVEAAIIITVLSVLVILLIAVATYIYNRNGGTLLSSIGYCCQRLPHSITVPNGDVVSMECGGNESEALRFSPDNGVLHQKMENGINHQKTNELEDGCTDQAIGNVEATSVKMINEEGQNVETQEKEPLLENTEVKQNMKIQGKDSLLENTDLKQNMEIQEREPLLEITEVKQDIKIQEKTPGPVIENTEIKKNIEIQKNEPLENTHLKQINNGTQTSSTSPVNSSAESSFGRLQQQHCIDQVNSHDAPSMFLPSNAPYLDFSSFDRDQDRQSLDSQDNVVQIRQPSNNPPPEGQALPPGSQLQHQESVLPDTYSFDQTNSVNSSSSHE